MALPLLLLLRRRPLEVPHLLRDCWGDRKRGRPPATLDDRRTPLLLPAGLDGMGGSWLELEAGRLEVEAGLAKEVAELETNGLEVEAGLMTEVAGLSGRDDGSLLPRAVDETELMLPKWLVVRAGSGRPRLLEKPLPLALIMFSHVCRSGCKV